ncbi:GLRA3 (predicted) [Pycnogonum litorale]
MASIGIILSFLSLIVFDYCSSEDLVQHFSKEYGRSSKFLSDVSGDEKTIKKPELNKSTLVETGIIIQDISSIDEVKGEYTLIFILITKWHDPRLTFNGSDQGAKMVKIERCPDKVWTPAINVVNNKASDQSISYTSENLCHIHPNGDIHHFSRMKMTLSCAMDFHKYPLDKQICSIELQSWLLPVTDMILKFRDENPFETTDTFHMMEFKLAYHTLTTIVKNYTDLGEHSTLIVSFHLVREIGHYLINYYVPSVIFVLASWSSFWLHPEAGPPRVTLALTTMLTLVTSAKYSSHDLPKISYVTALDVWNVVCTSFILLSLFEFAIVNVLARRGRWEKRMNERKEEDRESNVSHRPLQRCHSTRTICQEEITGIPRSVSMISLTDYADVSERDRCGTMNTDLTRLEDYKIPSTNTLRIPGMPKPPERTSVEVAEDGCEITIKVPTLREIVDHTDHDLGNSKREMQMNGKSGCCRCYTGLFEISQTFHKRLIERVNTLSRMPKKQLASEVDRKSRIVFPVAFVIFNAVYWSILLN